jgi:hypothetical protein
MMQFGEASLEIECASFDSSASATFENSDETLDSNIPLY